MGGKMSGVGCKCCREGRGEREWTGEWGGKMGGVEECLGLVVHVVGDSIPMDSHCRELPLNIIRFKLLVELCVKELSLTWLYFCYNCIFYFRMGEHKLKH